ncbi:hypothetical protein [Mesorhizobium sp. Cs1321R2N1]|uniref:hypothetical protein n=1 Tax=Mesorhizobium sp. Cs1321R2N1 TaxID=3015174 RepID=UPI00301BFDBA
MKLDDKPLLIYRLDPFHGWLESYMLLREPRVRATEYSISFFQSLMRRARQHGYIPGSGRVELMETVVQGFYCPSKTASCHAGIGPLLMEVFNVLLDENESHIELHEFCGFLIAALHLPIRVRDAGKKGVRFTSDEDLGRVEGIMVDVTIPRELRAAVETTYYSPPCHVPTP